MPGHDGGRVRIGCSGWQYREWRGIVYPPDLTVAQWFGWYASRFDTVELNATHYRLPAESTVAGWREHAPAGFVYAVKMGAFGSHRKKLREPTTWLPNHVERFAALGEHLGPTLVQLPPRWSRNVERLDEFLDAAPASMRWAVEFRDRSWLHDDVFEVLARHRAALCLHDMLPDHPSELTTDWTYVRFHGPTAPHEPYRGRYGPHRLAVWAERLAGVIGGGADVYAYFNNDMGGHAVTDARTLRSMLGSES